jgi:hypothetical protein
MKRAAEILLLGLTLFTAQGFTQIRVQVKPEMEVLVLMFKEKISLNDGLPMVRVELGKVLMRDGGFVRELPMRPNEIYRISELLQQQFRLYCGPKHFGVYTYAPVPNERKPKKSNYYLEAIPIDQDVTIQAMIAKSRIEADIQNLLKMTVEEATAATKNESTLKETLNKAISAEFVLLQNGKTSKVPLFFVPIRIQE